MKIQNEIAHPNQPNLLDHDYFQPAVYEVNPNEEILEDGNLAEKVPEENSINNISETYSASKCTTGIKGLC